MRLFGADVVVGGDSVAAEPRRGRQQDHEADAQRQGGANLAEMTDIGLPMPSGFTITTEVCDYDSAKGAHPCATVP